MASCLREKMRGCEIRVVNFSDEALDAHKNFAPDLTLLDISMPDIDGFDVLKRIDTSTGQNNGKVVMLSGSTDRMDMLESIKLGASSYRTKPSSLDAYQHLAAELLAECKEEAKAA
jgi:DNA-binding response OmpR family regulator